MLNLKDELLLEEQGISLVSYASAKKLVEVLNNKLETNHYLFRKDTDLYYYDMIFDYEAFDNFVIKCDVSLKLLTSLENYEEISQKHKSDINYNTKNNCLIIDILIYKKGFIPTSNEFPSKLSGGIVSSIEHEIKHAYQDYCRNFLDGKFGLLNNQKNNNLYHRARLEKKKYDYPKTDEDNMKKNIAHMIYHSFKSEQTAFQQELYKVLKQANCTHENVWKIVKQTNYYTDLERIKTLESKLSIDNTELNEYLIYTYKRDVNWMIKTLRNTIKKMHRVINRAVWFVLNETITMNVGNYNNSSIHIL